MPLPARGTSIIQEGTAASAFSRGDILTGGPSALSRMPPLYGADVTGFALTDSTKSVNGKVTYSIPGADEAFYVSVATNSALTSGALVTFSYSSYGDRNEWLAAVSATSIHGVVLKGVSEVNQSAASRVLVRPVLHDGKFLFT